MVNGYWFNAFASLEHSLNTLIGGAHNDHLLIWTDQICINQSNDAEKSLQVAFMRQIYEQSREVYVMLGRRNLGWDSLERGLWQNVGESDSDDESIYVLYKSKTIVGRPSNIGESDMLRTMKQIQEVPTLASNTTLENRGEVSSCKQSNLARRFATCFRDRELFCKVRDWLFYLEELTKAPWWTRAWVCLFD
jgi:hypothetical protein